MCNRLLPLTLGTALLMAACSQPSTDSAISTADEINDSNTPLHLMQPNYDHAYGIPTEESVKATMDRVLHFISEAMPAAADSGHRIVPGKFRLTTYECGVTYAATLFAGQITADSSYTHFATDRLDFIVDLAPKVAPMIEADPTYCPQMRRVVAPSALDDAGAMAAAMLRSGRTNYDAQIEKYVDYVRHREYRLKDGTFARNRPHSNTVWLDDMYMAVPCLAWYGNVRKDAACTDEAVRQLHLFKEKMWVADRQLFRHGWVESMQPHPAFHWGRANGWAILTLCEVLDNLPEGHKERPFVLGLLREHIEGLARLQDHTGLWHQLLDRNDTFLETSCTAIYTYCMAHAINQGWIDAQAYGAQVLLAWNALTDYVSPAGEVRGTCVGTGMGFDAAFYAYRPVHHMAAHGYGPLIWAGAEVINLLRTTHPKLNDSAVHFYETEQKTSAPIFSENASGEEIF